MSAYADAAAKTSLEKGMEAEEAEWLREKLIGERVGREFGYELRSGDGVAAPWHDAIFGMAREAAGAWVRRREAGRVRTGAAAAGTVLVDTARLGIVDTEGQAEYWGEVMRGTGAGKVVEREQARGRAVAEKEAAGVRKENARCGLAAAMRNGGEVRQATHGRWHREERQREQRGQRWGPACRREALGCPACCSAGRGWGWRRDEEGVACA